MSMCTLGFEENLNPDLSLTFMELLSSALEELSTSGKHGSFKSQQIFRPFFKLLAL